MNMQEQIDNVNSREDFIGFVNELRIHYKHNRKEWNNNDLPSYLEAMSAWVDDMEGYFQHINEPLTEQPTWKLFAQILAASIIYE